MSPYPWISEKPTPTFFAEMNAVNIPTGSDSTSGRGADGKFTKGNKGGPGNPYNRQVAAIRRALLNAVTPEEIHYLARSLIDRALEGNLAAAKLLLSYLIGKPGPAVDPDTLDQQEWQLHEQAAVPVAQLNELLNQVPADTANAIVQNSWPAVANGCLHSSKQETSAQSVEEANSVISSNGTPPTDALAPADAAPAQPTEDTHKPNSTHSDSPKRSKRQHSQVPAPTANGVIPNGPIDSNGQDEVTCGSLPPPTTGSPPAAGGGWQHLLAQIVQRAGLHPQ